MANRRSRERIPPFQAASELRMESIAAKRGDSAYRRGRSDWLKIKTAAGKENRERPESNH